MTHRLLPLVGGLWHKSQRSLLSATALFIITQCQKWLLFYDSFYHSYQKQNVIKVSKQNDNSVLVQPFSGRHYFTQKQYQEKLAQKTVQHRTCLTVMVFWLSSVRHIKQKYNGLPYYIGRP